MSRRRQLSRREFLRVAGLFASTVALEACTPQALTENEAVEAEPMATAPMATVTPVPPAPTATETPGLTITVVYDNVVRDARLVDTPWGFAALIERGDQTVLFDTGGDSPTLLRNMETLGKDPSTIQKVVLSHIHADHVGGLDGLLQTGVHPTVYVPPSFPRDFTDPVREITELVEVTPGQAIAEGTFTTGEMPTPGNARLVEQSLFVESRGGLVVITGCAHPGIVGIVRRVKELSDQPVFLAMGGFHLGSASDAELADIVADLRELEVGRVAPSHCTGDDAIAAFAEVYEDKFIRSGGGTIITI